MRESSTLGHDDGLGYALLPWQGQIEFSEKNVPLRRKMSKNNAIFA